MYMLLLDGNYEGRRQTSSACHRRLRICLHNQHLRLRLDLWPPSRRHSKAGAELRSGGRCSHPRRVSRRSTKPGTHVPVHSATSYYQPASPSSSSANTVTYRTVASPQRTYAHSSSEPTVYRYA